MRNRRKVTRRNSREPTSPRISRSQKKLVKNIQVSKNLTELITKKVVGTFSKATQEPVDGANMDSEFSRLKFDNSEICLGFEAEHEIRNSCLENKGRENETSNYVVDTIFSPSFHVGRSIGEEITTEDYYACFHHDSRQNEESEKNNIQIDTHGSVACLSPEVLTIYLSMRNSDLDCVHENQDHILPDVCQEGEDSKEYDDFDPYFFIKNLPDLSSVIPKFRPMLLPKQTRSCPSTSLVLDLDETLVHSTLELCNDADFTFPFNFNLVKHTVYVRCRPHLKAFLDRVSKFFEIIIFTAGQRVYAEQILNFLDPKRKIFRHRIYRDSCIFVDGNYLKDLSILGRDLARVIIIDNSPQVFGFQIDNGIPIESWFDNQSDTELPSLLPFLESLVGVEDVRPLIAQKYNLQEKIASAV